MPRVLRSIFALFRPPAGETWTYTWDAAGRLTQLTLPTGVVATYSYDDDTDHLDLVTWTATAPDPDVVLAVFDYETNAAGVPESMDEQVLDSATGLPRERRTVWEHDDLDRLTSELITELDGPGGGRRSRMAWPSGGTYASAAYRRRLKALGIRCSMSRRANCWDNAVAESFFATLKIEWLEHHRFLTRVEARAAAFDFIEVFYNRKRRHSSLGYATPEEYARSLKSA